jgi:hypothetical protein
MVVPVNKKLYELVKKESDIVFKSKTGVYKSSWIVREYKKRGGKYTGEKNKNDGILRWYNEKWIDLKRPIIKNKKNIGYEKCGRNTTKSGDYPLCRPSYKITNKTPKTYREISKKSINIAIKLKKNTKNIRFT